MRPNSLRVLPKPKYYLRCNPVHGLGWILTAPWFSFMICRVRIIMRTIIVTSLTRGLKNSFNFIYLFFKNLKNLSSAQKDSVICNGNTLCNCLRESEFRGSSVWSLFTAQPVDPQCCPLCDICWKSYWFLRVVFLDSQSNSVLPSGLLGWCRRRK